MNHQLHFRAPLIYALLIIACPTVSSADEDLGFGYVRRGETIHFTGGGITGTGAGIWN